MISRRDVLLGTPALLCAQAVAGAAPTAVQLLVVREGREPRACGERKFTPGALYGVPAAIKLQDAVPPLGMDRIAKVEELGYEGNTPQISAIPTGIYRAFIREDATKPWMTNRDRRWRIELQGVPGGRSAIQFHYGTDYSWSAGCIILTGDVAEGLSCRSAESTSEAVVARLRAYVESAGTVSPTPIQVRVMYAG